MDNKYSTLRVTKGLNRFDNDYSSEDSHKRRLPLKTKKETSVALDNSVGPVKVENDEQRETGNPFKSQEVHHSDINISMPEEDNELAHGTPDEDEYEDIHKLQQKPQETPPPEFDEFIDQEMEEDGHKKPRPSFGHLKFLKLLMGVSNTSAKDDDEFMPRDLGITRKASSIDQPSREPEGPLPKEQLLDKSFESVQPIEEGKVDDEEEFSNIKISKSEQQEDQQKDTGEEAKSTSTEERQRKSFKRQNTLLNACIRKTLFNEIITNYNNPQTKLTQSLQHKPSNDIWRLFVFEMGKKKYHEFRHKMQSYDIPLVPNDETLIV